MLLGRALRTPGRTLTPRWRDFACAVGGAFPDVDFALQPLYPHFFLNLHRGPTHSLVLLPLWAAVLALILAWLISRRGETTWRRHWWPCWQLCALGLLIHIAGDWVTLYGTQLFYPLSSQAYALGLSYDINPWFALVAIAGTLAGRWLGRVAPARIALVLAVALLAGQGALKQQALAVAAQVGAGQSHEVLALPQPLSPFHWHLILRDDAGYRTAYLDLLASGPTHMPAAAGWLNRLLAGYRAHDDLVWRQYAPPEQLPLSRQAWAHEGMAAFRAFAKLPVLYRIDGNARCIWFTDLRHALPGSPPPFRRGLCRAGTASEWHPYRLRYSSEEQRQAV